MIVFGALLLSSALAGCGETDKPASGSSDGDKKDQPINIEKVENSLLDNLDQLGKLSNKATKTPTLKKSDEWNSKVKETLSGMEADASKLNNQKVKDAVQYISDNFLKATLNKDMNTLYKLASEMKLIKEELK